MYTTTELCLNNFLTKNKYDHDEVIRPVTAAHVEKESRYNLSKDKVENSDNTKRTCLCSQQIQCNYKIVSEEENKKEKHWYFT